MADDYAWMDALSKPAAAPSKAPQGDPYAFMDSVPGLHDRLAPERRTSSLVKPKGYHGRTTDEEPLPLAVDQSRTNFGSAAALRPPENYPGKRQHTTTELEGDPSVQGIVGGAEGALVAAPIAGLVGLAAPALAPVVGGAVAGGTSTAAQGGDTKDVLIGAGLGALFATPTAGRAALKNAAGRVEERMQTNITGGSKGVAAKQVLASREILDETLDAHPDLKKTLQTSPSVAEKANAVRSKIDTLTEANDAATEAIAEHHGKISTDRPLERLHELAKRFEGAGDELGRDAVTSTIESIDSFSKGSGAITAQQLRGIRNGLAKTIQKKAPGLPVDEAVRTATAIKAELNETIADLAAETPGVDVAALKARNKQIASLLPVDRALQEQAVAKGLAQPHDTAAEIIEPHGARKMAANKVREVRAKADYALANNDTAKAVFPPSAADQDVASRFPDQARRATGAGFIGARAGAVDYAANVAAGMKRGLTLEQAVAEAKKAEEGK